MEPAISFKQLSLEHFGLLHKWMQESHVWQWWGEGRSWSLDDVAEKYSPYVKGYKIQQGEKKGISPFIVLHNELPIGYIQYYNAFDFPRDGLVKAVRQDLPQSLAALDFYIGETGCLGKGLGSDVLNCFLKNHVFHHYDACLAHPDRNNKAAIKAYSKAQFNTFHDDGPNIIMLAEKEQKRNPIIIFGSSRSNGNTYQAITSVIQDRPVPIVDLNKVKLSYYDYTYANSEDDFIAIAKKMIRHNPIILATPVYWYAMSGLMKTFMDRWTDLLDIRKDIGRRLAGKELFVVTSYSSDIPKGFEDPFSQTCNYLDMEYKGCLYFYCGDDPKRKEKNIIPLERFTNRIFQKGGMFAQITT